MWPPGHAAAGFLVYALIVCLPRRAPLRPLPVLAALFGSQFPDLVDKPLAWTFGVLPAGRSLAHSLLTAVILIAVLTLIFDHYRRGELAIAFSAGYLSHIAGDAVKPIVLGRHDELAYLLWPALPAPEYTTEPNFWAHIQAFTLDSFRMAEFALVGAALFVGLLFGVGTRLRRTA